MADNCERHELRDENVDVVIVRRHWTRPSVESEAILCEEIADVYDDGSIAVKNPDGTTNCIRHNGRWLRKDTFDEYVDAIKNRLNILKGENEQ